MSSALLTLSGVTAGYVADIDVLRNVSLSIEKGRISGLIGLNGAGKSTLMKTICGFLRPHSGRIEYDGEDITGIPPHTLIDRGIWYIPQESSLFPYMSVADNLRLPLERLRKSGEGERDARLRDALERFPALAGCQKLPPPPPPAPVKPDASVKAGDLLQEYAANSVAADAKYKDKNLQVTGKLARLMWDRRPNFVIHCGDVVDDGAAKGQWTGDLFKGSGKLKLGSGAYEGQYNFSSRFESATGTNPEELIAAAHASCFSMAFSAQLGEAGLTPDRIDTTATVTLEKTAAGFEVTASHLDMKAKIPGASQQQFETAANNAKAGCPISRLLNAKITMNASLE